MKLNSVIGSVTDFFFSLFYASLVWSELFEANLVGNRGDLAAEEHQRESSTVCVIELLWGQKNIFRPSSTAEYKEDMKDLPAGGPVKSLNFVHLFARSQGDIASSWCRHNDHP